MITGLGSINLTRRSINRARVFEVIHLHQPVFRAKIAALANLTSLAVTNIVVDLLHLDVRSKFSCII